MEREQDLYAPVKALLERQGYEVKGEVGAADVVARRAEEAPVIVELKLRFSLALFHQAIARQAVTDLVYVAVPRPAGRQARRMLRENLAMCRRLGLGLITIRARKAGLEAEVHCDPGAYAPRKSKVKAAKLLREFDRISGDPNTGGAAKGLHMTGYRQDALRCASYLAAHGTSRGVEVARGADVAEATRIMRENHYGWFLKEAKGIYALAPDGAEALATWGAKRAAAQESAV